MSDSGDINDVAREYFTPLEFPKPTLAVVRARGLLSNNQRELMEAFCRAAGGVMEADGMSFTVKLSPEEMAEMRKREINSPRSYLEALWEAAAWRGDQGCR